MKNYVGLGETFWGQGPTVRSIIRSCGVEEMLTEGPKLIGWEAKKESGGEGSYSARNGYGAGVPHVRGRGAAAR